MSWNHGPTQWPRQEAGLPVLGQWQRQRRFYCKPAPSSSKWLAAPLNSSGQEDRICSGGSCTLAHCPGRHPHREGCGDTVSNVHNHTLGSKIRQSWCHMPVILGLQEAETEDEHVQGLPGLEHVFKAIFGKSGDPVRNQKVK